MRASDVLHSELGMKKRKIGDHLCWRLHLDTGVQGMESLTKSKPISWAICYSKLVLEVTQDEERWTEIGFRGRIIVD